MPSKITDDYTSTKQFGSDDTRSDNHYLVGHNIETLWPIYASRNWVIVIWDFITCQNLHFGKYVGLTVCLSVCLFIRSRITLEPFEITSPKLVHRCILVAAPSLYLFKVKGQGHEVTAKVKIRKRRNSVNFWATAKFKKPQCSTPQGPYLWHHQLPISLPV